MTTSLTIDLPNVLMRQIEALSAEDGVSPEDWVRHVIKAHVFICRFRAAREAALRELDERGIHLTDQDVFRMMS